MVKYKIVHSTGEFSVDISNRNDNCFAKIFDRHALTEMIVQGKDEEDLYWNCRSWASSNIRGEFHFEPVSAKPATKDRVSVAA